MTGFFLIAVFSASATQFDLVAYEAPGMDPADKVVIVRDARSKLPALLRACGVKRFRNLPATDGAVVYRFAAELDGKAITCLRRKLPKGAQLLS